MTKEQVVVAMSGGVDSSVAAALLVEQGYQVLGVMLRLWSEEVTGDLCESENRCCTARAQRLAGGVAQALGIPFEIVDLADAFKRQVVDYFVAEYTAGRTPNPCVACNQHVRFGLFLDSLLDLGGHYLATGHYARVRQAQNGLWQLWRGVDPRKDQSYVLHTLGQEQLACLIFPLGEYTKIEVRRMARQRGLPAAEREESQDLCFVADGDYRRFLAEQAPDLVRPGPIRDSAGRVLGRHRGLTQYTIGQRKGLGIAAAEPLYVLALDPAGNALIVGPERELGRDVCLARRVSWVAGEPPADRFEATAKIRYKAQDVPVRVEVLGPSEIRAEFAEPLRDVTPGQFLVLYQDQVVLGGGAISLEDGA